MKKLFALMTLAISLSCGGGHKSPVPPPPPPVEFCGDGICSGTEHWTNCPQDCPPPAEICNKNNKCEPKKGETPDNCVDCRIVEPPPDKCGDEPLDPDCPKIVRNFDRHRILGCYTGPMSDPEFDFINYFSLLRGRIIQPNGKFKDGFNGAYLHMTSPWNRVNFFAPIKFKNGKPQFKEWNEAWWDKLDEMHAAAAYYDVELFEKLHDQYCDPKWFKYASYPSKGHEFLQVCGKDGATLYANWNRRDANDPKNFALFQFKNDTDTDSFKPVSDEGRYFMALEDRFFKHAAIALAKYPNLRLNFAADNEAYYYVEADEKTLNHSRSRYYDDRSLNYFFAMAKKHGVYKHKRVRFIINEEFMQEGAYTNMYWTDKTYRQYISKNDFLYEFHNLQDAGDYNFFLDKLKMNARHVLGSFDGKRENADYFKDSRDVLRTDPLYFDFKLFACYKKSADCSSPWSNTNMNFNINKFVPAYEAEVFK